VTALFLTAFVAALPVPVAPPQGSSTHPALRGVAWPALTSPAQRLAGPFAAGGGAAGGGAAGGGAGAPVIGTLSRRAHRRPLPRVTSRDRAATRAFLRAQHAYALALLANVPASVRAIDAVGGRLGRECPGVVSAAPPPERLPSFGEEPEPLSPRQQGEENRLERQRGELELELGSAFQRALLEPDQAAALAFARAVHRLRWSVPQVTAYAHLDAASVQAQLELPVADVCADMRAWAASGFRAVSPQTKAFVARLESPTRSFASSLSRLLFGEEGPDPAAFLRRAGGRRGRALERRTDRVLLDLLEELRGSARLEARVREILGIKEPAPPRSGPPAGSKLLAHGRVGRGTYRVWLLPKAAHGSGPACDATIAIQERETSHRRNVEVVSEGGGTSCLSREHPEPIRVYCDGNRFRIEGQTKPAARRVRLRLADGRAITAKVSVIPASEGGPIGFYLQWLPGRGSPPVSLSELDRGGRAIARVRLKHPRRCVEHRIAPPVTVPGSTATLARGSLPGGPAFTIRARRVRFMGHVSLQLEAAVATEAQGPLGGSGFGGLTAGFAGGPPTRRRAPFELQQEVGCQPHEYALLYGLLSKPRDTVLARTAAGLEPLRRVPLPARLHTSERLAYIALAALPEELLVRGPAGGTVFREDLRKEARELRETCEGESEG
jgi:hypothetical protein